MAIDFSKTYKLSYVEKTNPATGGRYQEWDGNTYAMRADFVALGNKARFVTLPGGGKTWITKLDTPACEALVQLFISQVCNAPASQRQMDAIAGFIEEGYEASGRFTDLDNLTAQQASELITEMRYNRAASELGTDRVDSSRDRKSA